MTDRRTVLKAIAATGAGPALLPLLGQALAQTAPKKIKAGDLAKLAKDWEGLEFMYEGIPSYLVRVPKPAKFDAKTSRELEVKDKDKDGKDVVFYLVAYQRVCTHLGCAVDLDSKDKALSCACHGSTYNAADGARTAGPARLPLTGLKIMVEKEVVYATGTL
jgi:Rieske Fe-S protein